MKLAQIENGIVTNVIEVDPASMPDWAQGWPEAGTANKGDTYENGVFTPPVLPNPVIAWRETATLTKAQFCVAVLRAGILSAADAKFASKGGWPQSFADALAELPSAINPDEAEIVWAAVSVVDRNDPVLATVAAAKGIPDATLDSMFGWTG